MNETHEASAPAFAHQPGRTDYALPMQGHSGCVVRVVNHGGYVCIEKAAQDPAYNARLLKQFDKQRSAGESNNLPFVRIPKILEVSSPDGLAAARMEYVYFLDSIDFFGTASTADIDRIVAMIVAYIDREVEESPFTEVPRETFGRKLDEISAALSAHGHLERYRSHIAAMETALARGASVNIPVGRCHGDLTFSNVMIASDSSAIALIDFLDSFIESPLVDIAKVRQDSRFCWSLMMAARRNDPVRFQMVMRYVDSQIGAHYAGRDWYAQNIDLVLALNMLRIAPYARRADVHDFLLDAISSLELPR